MHGYVEINILPFPLLKAVDRGEMLQRGFLFLHLFMVWILAATWKLNVQAAFSSAQTVFSSVQIVFSNVHILIAGMILLILDMIHQLKQLHHQVLIMTIRYFWVFYKQYNALFSLSIPSLHGY